MQLEARRDVHVRPHELRRAVGAHAAEGHQHAAAGRHDGRREHRPLAVQPLVRAAPHVEGVPRLLWHRRRRRRWRPALRLLGREGAGERGGGRRGGVDGGSGALDDGVEHLVGEGPAARGLRRGVVRAAHAGVRHGAAVRGHVRRGEEGAHRHAALAVAAGVCGHARPVEEAYQPPAVEQIRRAAGRPARPAATAAAAAATAAAAAAAAAALAVRGGERHDQLRGDLVLEEIERHGGAWQRREHTLQDGEPRRRQRGGRVGEDHRAGREGGHGGEGLGLREGEVGAGLPQYEAVGVIAPQPSRHGHAHGDVADHVARGGQVGPVRGEEPAGAREVDARGQPVRRGVRRDAERVDVADAWAEGRAAREHEDVLARLLAHCGHEPVQRRRAADARVVPHGARHGGRVQEVELEVGEAPPG